MDQQVARGQQLVKNTKSISKMPIKDPRTEKLKLKLKQALAQLFLAEISNNKAYNNQKKNQQNHN